MGQIVHENDILLRNPSGVVSPKLVFGDADTYLYESADDVLDLYVAGSIHTRFNASSLDHYLTIKTDTINEHTASAGVTIDGVLIKDEYIEFNEITAPAAPSANKGRLYMDSSDEHLYWRNSTTIFDLTLSGGGMVYPGVGIAVSTGSAWDTSLSATNLSSIAGLAYVSMSFVKMSASGTFTLDTNTYSLSNHTHTSKSDLPSTIVYTDQANTFGAFTQTFPSSYLRVANPANTFYYTIVGSAIAANRNLTIPLLTADATLTTGSGVSTRVAIWNSGYNLSSNANFVYSTNLTLTSGSYILATSGQYVGFNTSIDLRLSTTTYLKISTTTENIRIGQAAGNDSATGTNNILIGALAGYTIGNNATRSIGIGQNALRNLQPTSASQNSIAIGYYAGGGYLTTNTGGSNIFIGYQAGLQHSSGGNNIIIGSSASSDTGADNIAIGSGCGVVGAFANNILIGTSVTEYSVSNMLRIGNATTHIIIGSWASGAEYLASPYPFRTNTINEYTASTGVTIEGIKVIDSYFVIPDITAPGTPASGYGHLYVNADKLYFKNDAGTAYDLTSTGASISFGTDNQIPYTNAGATDFDYSSLFTFDGSSLSVDGLLIENDLIDAQDGSIKHLTITAGDASGGAGTDAGNIILKAGNAINADSGSNNGVVKIIPGNHYSGATGGGAIYMGDDTLFTGNSISISARSSATNVSLSIQQKGTESLGLGLSTGPMYISGTILQITPNINMYNMTASIYGMGGQTSAGGSLTIKGGAAAAGDYNGGNLYLYGGALSGTGTTGLVYIGTGSTGTNPLTGSGTGTSVLLYNRTTGQISYGDMSGGVTPVDDILDWATDRYQPYSDANKAAGRLYSYTATLPSNTTALAYDGYFYATQGYFTSAIYSGAFSGSTYEAIVSSTQRMFINPTASDGSGATTVMFLDTHFLLTNTSSRLISLRNQGTEMFYVTKDGAVYSNGVLLIGSPFSTNLTYANTGTGSHTPYLFQFGTGPVHYMRLAYNHSAAVVRLDFDTNNDGNYSAYSSPLIAYKGAQIELQYGASKRFETTSTGISITGNFTATADSAISTAAGSYALLAFRSATIRWNIGKDNVAETGSNVGSDFRIYRYDDGGGYLGNPLVISRSTGAATFDGIVSATRFGVGITSYLLGVSGGVADVIGYFYNSDVNGYGVNIRAGVGSLYSLRVAARDDTTLFRINGNGNVGIGTVSPSTKLEVFGPLRVTGTSAAGYQFTKDADDTDLVLSYYSDATTKHKDLISFNYDGNVGIGTTAPLKKLVVSNGGALGFEIDPVLTADVVNLLAYNRTTSAYKNLQIDASQTSFASGNVGIGTTTPPSLLSLSKGSAAMPTSISKANNYIQIGINDYAPSGPGYAIIGFGYSQTSNTHAPAYIGYVETTAAGQTYGDLVFGTRSVTTDTLPTERMRIDSGGYVGINATPTSSYRLYVGGSIYATGNITGNSDIRYKTVLGLQYNPWYDGYDKLNIIRFKYLGEEDENIGYSAQNLQEYFPNCVTVDHFQNGRLGIKILPMVALNTLAIQKVKSEVDILKGRILDLEKEVALLKNIN